MNSTFALLTDLLLALLTANLPALIAALSQHSFVELSRTPLTIHA